MVAKFKKKKKRSLFKDVFLVIFLGLLLLTTLGFLIVTNLKLKRRREKILTQVENLEKEIRILEERNEQLRTKISQAGSREALEKIAREQFGLKAPGEEVVVISKEEKEKEETETQEEKSFWNPKVWWEWIKSKL